MILSFDKFFESKGVNVEEILNGYIHSALWTEELDDRYDISDVQEDSLEKARRDIKLFVQKAGDLLNGIDNSSIGHDFWLTRNGHGAGFWDRKELEGGLGDKLTDICKDFKEVNVFDEDGSIIIE